MLSAVFPMPWRCVRGEKLLFVGEENFLKEAFLPPYPYLSRTLKRGVVLSLYGALKNQFLIFKNMVNA